VSGELDARLRRLKTELDDHARIARYLGLDLAGGGQQRVLAGAAARVEHLPAQQLPVGEAYERGLRPTDMPARPSRRHRPSSMWAQGNSSARPGAAADEHLLTKAPGAAAVVRDRAAVPVGPAPFHIPGVDKTAEQLHVVGQPHVIHSQRRRSQLICLALLRRPARKLGEVRILRWQLPDQGTRSLADKFELFGRRPAVEQQQRGRRAQRNAAQSHQHAYVGVGLEPVIMGVDGFAVGQPQLPLPDSFTEPVGRRAVLSITPVGIVRSRRR
jgi:hypothetical protein